MIDHACVAAGMLVNTAHDRLKRASSGLLLRFGGLHLRFSPGHPFPAGAETGEITTAGSAAVRGGAEFQQQTRPERRMVVLLAPSGQILPITARASCESPSPGGPDACFPAPTAAPAPQGIDTGERLTIFA